MKPKLCILLLLLVLGLCCTPALATATFKFGDANWVNSGNTWLSSVATHDQTYMPLWTWCIFAIIGLGSLFISRVWESAEDIFAIGAVAPLGMAAWYANYITYESYDIVVYSGYAQMLFNQIVHPNPALSIVFVIFLLLSIFNVIWIFVLKPSQRNTV